MPLRAATILLSCFSVAALAANSQEDSIREITLTSIPPHPVSVFVRFTDPLDKSHAEDLQTSNVSVTGVCSRQTLVVKSVTRHIVNRRELVIGIGGVVPENEDRIRVCFVSLHFGGKPDPVSGDQLCAVGDILTPQNIEEKVRSALFTLRGRVDSKSERVLENIKVTQAVLDPGTVSDAFGRRIARRYVALQVTVANSDPDYQFLIHDIKIRLPLRHIEQSSVELSILRGTAEKGQLLDTRNWVGRLLRGLGTIAAGALAIDKFGHSYAPSVAMYNGPLITAYEAIFPDFTINQMNRLNDSAYSANKLVPARQARVMVAFIPQSELLAKEEKEAVKKDPHQLWEILNATLSETSVSGNFITNVDEIPPAVTAVVFGDDMKKFQNDNAVVKGYVLGQFLSDSKPSLGEGTPDGMTIELDGTPTDTRLEFTMKSKVPVPPNQNLELVVTKGKSSTKFTRAVQYLPDQPTLGALDPSAGSKGEKLEIKGTGTSFLPGNTRALITGCTGVSLANQQADVRDSKSLTFSIQIDSAAGSGKCSISVMTLGQPSQPIQFEVK